MSDASQCAVTFHVPATLGHAALPPSADGEPADVEFELQAQSSNSVANKLRIIPAIVTAPGLPRKRRAASGRRLPLLGRLFGRGLVRLRLVRPLRLALEGSPPHG